MATFVIEGNGLTATGAISSEEIDQLIAHGHDPRLVKHVHIPHAHRLYARGTWAKHPYVVLHELAHAYDCQDNGVMDGSPISRPDQRPAWASEYCWAADAEWYACAVVQYRTLFPDEVAPWGHEEAVPAPVAPRARRCPGP